MPVSPNLVARLVDIASSNDRLTDIVNDILDLEKISSEVTFDFADTDLTEVLTLW
jgi:signal transduction histidine kinase